MTQFVAATGTKDEYIGHRLQFQRTFALSDQNMGKVPWWRALSALVIWYLATAAIWAVCAFFLSLIFGYSVASSGDASGPALLVFMLILLWLGITVATAFIPMRLWVGHWEFVVDDRAGAATQSYARISQVLNRRRTPAVVSEESINNVLGAGARRYVHVVQGKYEVWVSVFPFGTDLYIGWGMFRNDRLAMLVFRFIKERVLAIFGKASEFHFWLAGDDARALRDIVHNAAREGVELAMNAPATPAVSNNGPTPASAPAPGTPMVAPPPAPGSQPVAPPPTAPPGQGGNASWW